MIPDSLRVYRRKDGLHFVEQNKFFYTKIQHTEPDYSELDKNHNGYYIHDGRNVCPVPLDWIVEVNVAKDKTETQFLFAGDTFWENVRFFKPVYSPKYSSHGLYGDGWVKEEQEVIVINEDGDIVRKGLKIRKVTEQNGVMLCDHNYYCASELVPVRYEQEVLVKEEKQEETLVELTVESLLERPIDEVQSIIKVATETLHVNEIWEEFEADFVDLLAEATVDYPAGREAGPSVNVNYDELRAIFFKYCKEYKETVDNLS